MAVLAFTSAKGSPGVTTTVLGTALQWHQRSLLIEADVSGSSSIMAGYLRGELKHDRGLLKLAIAQRHDSDISSALDTNSVPLMNSNTRLVPGLEWSTQARTMAPLWEHLPHVLHALERTGVDVFIDAGRLGTVGGPQPVLHRADTVVVVTRSNLPAIAATRARVAYLRENLTTHGTGDDAIQLLIVGEGQPYSAREITKVVGVPVVATVAWDPVNAEVFSLGASRSRKFSSSALVRSLATVASALSDAVDVRRNRLIPGQAGSA